jgi:cyclopropane fatty-acyl-phospholipid synthase-like methyltransferase
VLDIGCGTGEHALLAASLGLDATGIDGAESAIKIARQKAIERGLVARFLVGDVLALEGLGEQFDTVIDSNLFQVFSDAERPRYVSSLASVVPAGGRFFLLCFSDHQPGREGPRRVSKAEIRESFAEGWEVERIDEVRINIFLQGAAVIAWLADIRRR